MIPVAAFAFFATVSLSGARYKQCIAKANLPDSCPSLAYAQQVSFRYARHWIISRVRLRRNTASRAT
jgi:hypothetical protein